ncbi:hypothetical protein ABDB91_09830 [Desulfoscipio sp. XC116]|uniref:hypothetical protein n=1 Tax=Desulfoscipio sp. XC116 TaxID=3144975 RepID=UPI00325B394C
MSNKIPPFFNCILEDKTPRNVDDLFKLPDTPIIQGTQAIKQGMYDLDLYRDIAKVG